MQFMLSFRIQLFIDGVLCCSNSVTLVIPQLDSIAADSFGSYQWLVDLLIACDF